MHDVYIISDLTGEESFRKEAFKRLAEGDGFTTFHYHAYSVGGVPTTENKAIHTQKGCRVNDPYLGHMYVKSPAGVRGLGEGTCALYNNLDRAGFEAGGHCPDCHCTCAEIEEGDDRDLRGPCTEHEPLGCRACLNGSAE